MLKKQKNIILLNNLSLTIRDVITQSMCLWLRYG